MKLPSLIEDNKTTEKLEKMAKSTPYILLMEMIKLIPILGGYVDETIAIKLSNFQSQKRNELIDHIIKDKDLIHNEDISKVEFIIGFTKTVEAVDRLSSISKIKYFSNLLKQSFLKLDNYDADSFDEHLDTLNSLSYREINLLHAIYKYESTLSNLTPFNWSDLYKTITENSDLDIEEIKSIFMRLQGKGLMYAEIEMNYFVTKNSLNEIKGTTSYCKKFISRIIDLE